RAVQAPVDVAAVLHAAGELGHPLRAAEHLPAARAHDRRHQQHRPRGPADERPQRRRHRGRRRRHSGRMLRTIRMGMMTARIASPAMKPEAIGVICSSALLGDSLRQIASITPPSTIIRIATPGSSMPRPVALADGRNFLNRCSNNVSRMPAITAMMNAVRQPLGSAWKPFDRISAKPAHFTAVGAVRPCSPPTPYFDASTGYTSATAAAPIGTASSCAHVRMRLFEPIILPVL